MNSLARIAEDNASEIIPEEYKAILNQLEIIKEEFAKEDIIFEYETNSDWTKSFDISVKEKGKSEYCASNVYTSVKIKKYGFSNTILKYKPLSYAFAVATLGVWTPAGDTQINDIKHSHLIHFFTPFSRRNNLADGFLHKYHLDVTTNEGTEYFKSLLTQCLKSPQLSTVRYPL